MILNFIEEFSKDDQKNREIERMPLNERVPTFQGPSILHIIRMVFIPECGYAWSGMDIFIDFSFYYIFIYPLMIFLQETIAFSLTNKK